MTKRKGIIIIMMISALLTIIMPFYHINAEYSYDFNNLMAYSFWIKYGYSNSDIDTVSLSVPYQLYQGSIDNVRSRIGVYDNGGTRLGNYSGSNPPTIYYGSSGSCNAQYCYIAYEPIDDSDISFHINNFNISGTISSGTWIPWITSSSPNRYTQYTWSNSISINNAQDYHITFLCDQWFSNVDIYSANGGTLSGTVRPVNETGGIYLFDVTLKGSSSSYERVTIDFPFTSNFRVVPIYCGRTNGMPDDVYLAIYGQYRDRNVSDDQTHTLLDTGNSSSQQSASNLDNTTSQFNTATNQYHATEQTLINDFDSKLNNITLNNDLITNNNFLTSANWVRTQFNNMINNNPFGSMIYFSLSLGLALVIIGKLRS